VSEAEEAVRKIRMLAFEIEGEAYFRGWKDAMAGVRKRASGHPSEKPSCTVWTTDEDGNLTRIKGTQ
jgi:hypothetical protein